MTTQQYAVLEGLASSEDVVRNVLLDIEEKYKTKVTMSGHPTGFRDLDAMISGLNSGELVVIAAAPGMGKTALALNMAKNLSVDHKKKVAFFSLETTRESTVTRLIAQTAKISPGTLRNAKISETAWPKLIEASSVLVEADIFFDDSIRFTPEELFEKCRVLKEKSGLDVLIVDYLQLMRVSNPKMDNREREVGDISRCLKMIAKELKIAILALSQISRKYSERTEKRPFLTDLRESGSIEADADIVLLLYRTECFDAFASENLSDTELIVAKNRLGPTGVIKLKFNEQIGVFSDEKAKP